jgi:hypothetical protein
VRLKAVASTADQKPTVRVAEEELLITFLLL